MRSSTLIRVVGVLIVAVLIGGLIGWLASRNPHPSVPVPEPVAPVAEEPEQQPRTTSTKTKLEPIAEPDIAPATNVAFDPALWDDRLDEILGDPDDDTDRKAREMLDMMDKVSVEAQTEIAGHIINLVDDNDFVTRAAKYLTNAEVPEAVSSVFMNDLYNRDDTMKLPLLLAMVRNEKHPLREEAKDLLELYVEEDFGTNWTQWEEATKKYLKEHSGEAAEPEQP